MIKGSSYHCQLHHKSLFSSSSTLPEHLIAQCSNVCQTILRNQSHYPIFRAPFWYKSRDTTFMSCDTFNNKFYKPNLNSFPFHHINFQLIYRATVSFLNFLQNIPRMLFFDMSLYHFCNETTENPLILCIVSICKSKSSTLMR